MFAYCMNNPVMGTDPDGDLPYPGFIHNKVVNKIADKHGYFKEQIISYGKTYGRADLISPSGEVWDVKPNSERHIKRGEKQVNNYVENTWLRNTNNVELSIGGPIKSGNFSFEDSSIIYDVSYRYARNGVIVYDYSTKLNKEKVSNAAGGIFTAGSLYGMYKIGKTVKKVGWVLALLPP